MAETPSEDVHDMVAMDWKRDDDKFVMTFTYRDAEIVVTDRQTEFEDGQPGNLESLFATLPECIDIIMEQAFPNHNQEELNG